MVEQKKEMRLIETNDSAQVVEERQNQVLARVKHETRFSKLIDGVFYWGLLAIIIFVASSILTGLGLYAYLSTAEEILNSLKELFTILLGAIAGVVTDRLVRKNQQKS